MPVEFLHLNPERIFRYARLENPLNYKNGCYLQKSLPMGRKFLW